MPSSASVVSKLDLKKHPGHAMPPVASSATLGSSCDPEYVLNITMLPTGCIRLNQLTASRQSPRVRMISA